MPYGDYASLDVRQRVAVLRALLNLVLAAEDVHDHMQARAEAFLAQRRAEAQQAAAAAAAAATPATEEAPSQPAPELPAPPQRGDTYSTAGHSGLACLLSSCDAESKNVLYMFYAQQLAHSGSWL